MPTLNGIGKKVVVKHHTDMPLRLPEPVPERWANLSTERCRFVMIKDKRRDSTEPLLR